MSGIKSAIHLAICVVTLCGNNRSKWSCMARSRNGETVVLPVTECGEMIMLKK